MSVGITNGWPGSRRIGAARAGTVAPGIARVPRADRLAARPGGFAVLHRDALVLTDRAGVETDRVPLDLGVGLTVLADGSLLALDRRADRVWAVHRTENTHDALPTRVRLARSPLPLLADPGDAAAFWVLSPDLRSARRHRLARQGDGLAADPPFSLPNSQGSDVAAVPGGLVLADATALIRVSAGEATRLPWGEHAPVERFASTSGRLWALAQDGVLHGLEIATDRVEERVRAALPGVGAAVAADDRGVAALVLHREPGGGPVSWTLLLLDPTGAEQARFEGAGDPHRSVALGADRVALLVPDAEPRLRTWPRPEA